MAPADLTGRRLGRYTRPMHTPPRRSSPSRGGPCCVSLLASLAAACAPAGHPPVDEGLETDGPGAAGETDETASVDTSTVDDTADRVDTDLPSAAGCGAWVEDYTYVVPFAPTAAWNVPVCDLQPWEHSDDYAGRFWRFSFDRDADPAVDDPRRRNHDVLFGFEAENDFALPVYDAADATTTRRVRVRAGWGGTNLAPTDTVPWNPAWKAMRGSDASLVILDHVTGREWDLWGVVQKDANGLYNDSQCWLNVAGYSATTDLCVGSAHLVEDPSGAVADFRTYAGNHPSRGVQIQHYAMLTQPEEVAAGEIRHALMMGVSNTLFGPPCTPAELGTSAAGSTCGFALAPAGGLEWGVPWKASPYSEQEQRERSIPEGMRLALRLTDGEIDAWLDERGYTGTKRQTARVFAVALRDYGWFITDTGGSAPWSVSGGANPATAAKWRDLGVDGNGRDLLHGLVTEERLWVVEPATNHCASGAPSHHACPAAVTGY